MMNRRSSGRLIDIGCNPVKRSQSEAGCPSVDRAQFFGKTDLPVHIPETHACDLTFYCLALLLALKISDLGYHMRQIVAKYAMSIQWSTGVYFSGQSE